MTDEEKLVKSELKDYSITFRIIKDTGEYRVNITGPRSSEATAYYTNNLNDALATGIAMRESEQRGQYASREEQHSRYIDCGSSAWDDN